MKSPDTNVREAYNWKDLRRRVFFADTRDNSNVISTKVLLVKEQLKTL
ncbi:hypothetical protein NW739_02205 [Mycoplasmopsis felis]|nr:hypothetical protein [Mycoplasmopsis felis]MCU9939599.1 hypothetical protein [Mycoplasmopsis felis]